MHIEGRNSRPTRPSPAAFRPFRRASGATGFEESQTDLTFIFAMPRFRILSLALFCLLVCGGRAASAASGDGDARRAEAIAAKLRLLDAAAASGDADAYRKLAGKLFPGLFVSVSQLHD